MAADARKAAGPRTCRTRQACCRSIPNLRETPEADPSQRTEWNVRDTGRLMVPIDSAGLAVSKGTGLAIGTAKKLGKPNIVIDMDAGGAGVLAMGFVGEGQGPSALCTAGPRESEAPGIYAKTRAFLGGVLRLLIVTLTTCNRRGWERYSVLPPARRRDCSQEFFGCCAASAGFRRCLEHGRSPWSTPNSTDMRMDQRLAAPAPAVLKSIQQSIKKSHALSAADVRLASYMGLIAAVVSVRRDLTTACSIPRAKRP